MKKIIFLSLIILFNIASSCSSKKGGGFEDLKLVNDSDVVRRIIKPDYDLVIELPPCYYLIIPKGSLVYEDETKVNENVEIRIKEYLDYPSMLSKGLETIAKEGVLESDGMFHIDVKAPSGKKVIINKKKPMRFATKCENYDFSLFRGEKNDKGIIWSDPVKAMMPEGWGRTDYIATDVYSLPLFEMFALGWINIDSFVGANPDVKLGKVSIKVKVKQAMEVTLLLKKRKVIVHASLIKADYIIENELPLEEAVIVAVNTVGKNIYFAQKEILIGRDNEVQLEMKPATKEEIMKALIKDSPKQ